MKSVGSADFLRWAASVGVGFDPRYSDSGCLILLPPTENARFWLFPRHVGVLPDFLDQALDGLDEWSIGYLWPRSGQWPDWSHSGSPREDVRNVVLRGARIPSAFSGAIRFDRDELDAIIAVFLIYVAFGWCVDDDLFFVPEHGRQLMHSDHHDVLHVLCDSEERMLQMVSHMSVAGYELPVELPDETFRRPRWMAKG